MGKDKKEKAAKSGKSVKAGKDEKKGKAAKVEKSVPPPNAAEMLPPATDGNIVKAVRKSARTPAVKAPSTRKTAPPEKPVSAAPAALVARKAKRKTLTAEQIALEAYFIAEERHRTGAPGSPHGDWLEAERRLRGN